MPLVSLDGMRRTYLPRTFQDVRPLPNLILLWLHGALLLLTRAHVRHPWLRGDLLLRQEDLFHGQDRLKPIGGGASEGCALVSPISSIIRRRIYLVQHW